MFYCVTNTSWVGGDPVCTVQPTLAGWEEIMCICLANTSYVGEDQVGLV